MASWIKAALLACVISTPAWGQEHPIVNQHAWISKHNNSRGQGCCHASDTFPLKHEQAAGLKIGSKVTVSRDGRKYTFTVDSIFPTQDPNGVPWITRYGCLFTVTGI